MSYPYQLSDCKCRISLPYTTTSTTAGIDSNEEITSLSPYVYIILYLEYKLVITLYFSVGKTRKTTLLLLNILRILRDVIINNGDCRPNVCTAG